MSVFAQNRLGSSHTRMSNSIQRHVTSTLQVSYDATATTLPPWTSLGFCASRQYPFEVATLCQRRAISGCEESQSSLPPEELHLRTRGLQG